MKKIKILRKKLFGNGVYENDPKTEKEFLEFLKYQRVKVGITDDTDEKLKDILDEYFKKTNKAVYGLRVLLGAKDRNPKEELTWVIISAIIGFFIATLFTIYIL